MASACVNSIGVSPENFLDCPPSAFPAYGWLSPGVSFSREYSDDGSPEKKLSDVAETSDLAMENGDFEFRLDDPVTMISADELFSDGKLVPLQLSAARPAAAATTEVGVRSPEACSRGEEMSVTADPFLFSPKAPRCSRRWRELLGLKKNKQESSSKVASSSVATTSYSSSNSSSSNTGKSIRHFLHRASKSMSSAAAASDASLSLPLLKDSDCESLSIPSSRLSLSSSSPGHDHDDVALPSLDADNKPSHSHIYLSPCSSGPSQSLNHHRVRLVKPRMVPASVAENPKPLIDHPSAPTTTDRVGWSLMARDQQDSGTITKGVSVDSPRMNPSGKVVFQSLERSSSSPSSLNGGPRYRHRGMERSYSTNVRVTPVLNVPVCSLRGSSKSGVFRFGHLFSSQSQKKESNGGSSSSGSSKSIHHHHHLCNSRPRKQSS